MGHGLAVQRHDRDPVTVTPAGHGVGIDIHESPWLGPRSTDTLGRGDVVTVEPGIYLPGDYGVRIEDTALIDSEVRVLTGHTRELLVL